MLMFGDDVGRVIDPFIPRVDNLLDRHRFHLKNVSDTPVLGGLMSLLIISPFPTLITECDLICFLIPQVAPYAAGNRLSLTSS